jgi:type II secretory pathway pseudopilin PulG
MLALTAAVVLIGVAAMLVIGGRIAEDRLDDRVEEVNKDFDASLNRYRLEVRRELDARLPEAGTGGAVPTATPSPTPTPMTSPEGDATATATASPTSTATTEASPTETPTTTRP